VKSFPDCLLFGFEPSMFTSWETFFVIINTIHYGKLRQSFFDRARLPLMPKLARRYYSGKV